MLEKTPSIFIDLSLEHFELIRSSADFKLFKQDSPPSRLNDKRFRKDMTDYLKGYIIDYYSLKLPKPSPQTIHDFNKGRAVIGKVRIELPADVFQKFSDEAKGELRSLKAQALYLIIPLITTLLKDSV